MVLTFHGPNSFPNERPRFRLIEETEDGRSLRIVKKSAWYESDDAIKEDQFHEVYMHEL